MGTSVHSVRPHYTASAPFTTSVANSVRIYPPRISRARRSNRLGCKGKSIPGANLTRILKRARKPPHTPSERIPERRWKAIYRPQACSCSPTEKAWIEKVGRSGLQCTDWRGAATEIEQRRQEAASAGEVGEKEDSPKKNYSFWLPFKPLPTLHGAPRCRHPFETAARRGKTQTRGRRETIPYAAGARLRVRYVEEANE